MILTSLLKRLTTIMVAMITSQVNLSSQSAEEIYRTSMITCGSLRQVTVLLRSKRMEFESRDTVVTHLRLVYCKRPTADSDLSGQIRVEILDSHRREPTYVYVYDGTNTTTYDCAARSATLHAPPMAREKIALLDDMFLPFLWRNPSAIRRDFDGVTSDSTDKGIRYVLLSTKRNIRSGPIPVDSVISAYTVDGHSHLPFRYRTTVWMLGEVQYSDMELLSVDTSTVSEDLLRQPPPGSYAFATATEKKGSSDAAGKELSEPQVGGMAPDFVMVGIGDSINRRLSDFKGKHVLVTFWQMSCSFCLLSSKHLQTISESFDSERLAVIAVDHMDRSDILRRYVEKTGYTFGVNTVVRGDVDSYNISGYPRFYLINPEGRIVYVGRGYAEGLPGLHAAVRREMEMKTK